MKPYPPVPHAQSTPGYSIVGDSLMTPTARHLVPLYYPSLSVKANLNRTTFPRSIVFNSRYEHKQESGGRSTCVKTKSESCLIHLYKTSTAKFFGHKKGTCIRYFHLL